MLLFILVNVFRRLSGVWCVYVHACACKDVCIGYHSSGAIRFDFETGFLTWTWELKIVLSIYNKHIILH